MTSQTEPQTEDVPPRPNPASTRPPSTSSRSGPPSAANAERAFRAHQSRLAELGVSNDDMIEAVNMALRVKGDPHSQIMALAQTTLVGESAGGCCGGACACEEAGGQKGDCGDDCDCH